MEKRTVSVLVLKFAIGSTSTNLLMCGLPNLALVDSCCVDSGCVDSGCDSGCVDSGCVDSGCDSDCVDSAWMGSSCVDSVCMDKLSMFEPLASPASPTITPLRRSIENKVST